MKLAGCARLSDITSDLLYADPVFRTVCFNGDSAIRTGAIEAPPSVYFYATLLIGHPSQAREMVPLFSFDVTSNRASAGEEVSTACVRFW